MALIIPTISSCSEKITAGEKRLARLLEGGLSEQCTCWYDTRMGDKDDHPDFVILAPEKGLLFLEVKDWFISKIKSANKTQRRTIFWNPLLSEKFYGTRRIAFGH